MKIFVIDTINHIPSHSQFQNLCETLVVKGHCVIQFSDTPRPDYKGVRVVSYSNKDKWLTLRTFLIEFVKIKPDVIISTFRGNHYADILSYLFDFKWIAFHQSDFYHLKFYNSFRFRKVSKYLGVSSPMVPKISRMFNFLQGRVSYINNSFGFKDIQEYPKRNYVLHVGGATKNAERNFVKGTDLLIKAFNQFMMNANISAELWIVGDGPFLHELRAMAHGNDSIRFTGKVTNAEVHALMKLSKLVVLPSRNDAFPNVFLEAIQYGCSLIGTEGTGAVDIIEKGKFGCITPQEDIGALAIAIEELLNGYEFAGAVKAYADKRIQFSRERWVNTMIKYIYECI